MSLVHISQEASRWKMNRLVLSISPGLPSGSVVKNPPASQEPHPEDVVQSLGQEDPLEEGNSL